MSDLTPETLADDFDPNKVSIMSGWLVYDVGEHTCGGYGPESGYAHEPTCGYEPMIKVDEIPALLDAADERDAELRRLSTQAATAERDRQLAWRAMDSARAEKGEAIRERDALAAKVERVRALPIGPPSGGYYMVSMRDVRAALDGEARP